MASTIQRKGPYDQFLLFGDSLTQQSASQESGFAFMPALQNEYIRRLDVINRGFSGYNTKQALAVLPSFMPKPSQAKIRFMTIFLGSNDACLPSSPTNQHIPLSSYTTNLSLILTHPTITPHSPHLILITPPPIDEHLLSVQTAADSAPRSRTQAHTKKYADAAREVGRTHHGVAVLDLWRIFMERAGWKGEGEEGGSSSSSGDDDDDDEEGKHEGKEGEKLPGSIDLPPNKVLQGLLTDGLHFRPEAYRIMYEELMALVGREWPDEVPEEVEFVYKPWREFMVD